MRIRNPKELLADREGAGIGRMLATLAVTAIVVLFAYYIYGKGKNVADAAEQKTINTINSIQQ